MTSDATGSGSVTDPGDATDQWTHLTYDTPTSELSPAESRSLAPSRKIAFFVLAACSLLAVAGAVYFWYLWVLTAKTCIDTYIRPSTTEILESNSDPTWQETFSKLDISSFSALILAMFLTRLAYGGTKNTLRFYRRDGRSYFGRAYRSVLFSEGFETLCVRFGLLGTLLSFLLAAVWQMYEVAGASESASGMTATGQESLDIFLLLCASLVSTFVGTGVAYVITPSFNWLNERAVGIHQMGQADATFATAEFFRQISRTSRRLAHFETTTMKLAEAAEHVSSFEMNVAAAARNLVDLTAGLERAIQTFDISTQTGKQLSKKLDQLEAMSDRMSSLLDRLPERLNDPLKNMSLMAKEFRDVALSGETAFRELKEVAGAARGPLSETTNRANTSWQMLREVQESLRELAKSEERQTSEVAKLVQAFHRVGDCLEGAVSQLDCLAGHLRHRDGDGDMARPLAAHRLQVGETAYGLSGEDGQSMARHRYAPAAAQRDRSRPWWRRIFD